MYLLILLIFLFLLYLCFNLYRLYFGSKEGFDTIKHNTLYSSFKPRTYYNNDIYDEFYSFIYDDLYFNVSRYENNSKFLIDYLNTYGNSLIVGSKTGHYNMILSDSMRTYGMDESPEMIKISNYKYPNLKFKEGGVSNPHLFEPTFFTHIGCFDLEFHKINNIDDFFSSTSRWLIHNGYLFITYYPDIHNINIDKMLNKDNISYLNLNFNYKMNMDNNRLVEEIEHKNTHKKRRNIQDINNINEEELLTTSKMYGLFIMDKVETRSGEYIYIFQKKN
jgi:SAM-dependent methyltransferase